MATKKNIKSSTVEKQPQKPAEQQTNSFMENYGSTILGFVVILILGSFLFNIFRSPNSKNDGTVGNTGDTTQEEMTPGNDTEKKHTVQAGEDLWEIAEKYYQSGYNWVDIAKANNLTDPNTIVTGQELIIPVAEQIVVGKMQEVAPTEPVVTPETRQKGEEAVVTPVATISPAISGTASSIYEVVAGDNLWKVAVKVYNDGYQWVKIAQANKLVNPGIIHPGNVLNIP